MTCLSIGFFREDGDFHILATINNNDHILPDDVFDTMRTTIFDWCNDTLRKHGIETKVLGRQDTPDYVSVDDD